MEQSIEELMANMRPAANYYELALQEQANIIEEKEDE